MQRIILKMQNIYLVLENFFVDDLFIKRNEFAEIPNVADCFIISPTIYHRRIKICAFTIDLWLITSHNSRAVDCVDPYKIIVVFQQWAILQSSVNKIIQVSFL